MMKKFISRNFRQNVHIVEYTAQNEIAQIYYAHHFFAEIT